MDKVKYMLPVEEVESGAMEQLKDIASKDFVKKIVVCPDVHKGYGVPIGAVVLMDGVISPEANGYDLFCGVQHVTTHIPADYFLDMVNIHELDKKIRALVPVGGNVHISNPGASHDVPVGNFSSASGDADLSTRVAANCYRQLGTLGGKTSNHFIEVGVVEGKNVIGVTIHSGSRNPGYCIADYYLKKFGGYLDFHSPEGQAYYQDLLWAKSWARLNRGVMMKEVLNSLGLYEDDIAELKSSPKTLIDIQHNFCEITEEGILHRKGATPAHKGQMGLIPANMLDGVYIVRGLGNEHYLNSCSHGAGRRLGRNVAKKTLSLFVFEEQVAESGVVAKVSRDTIEESKQAYKSIEKVLDYQHGNVIEVVDWVRPLLNIKG